MESEGVPIPSISSSPPPTSDDRPDFSPARSPDLSDHHQLTPPSDQPPSSVPDDLRDKIIKQVEYYFSDENLPSDKILMKYVSKDKEGYVPIAVVASFRKMKKLTRDISVIVSALRESSLLVVSNSGKKVKRLQTLPSTEAKDPMLCTVLVENLPDDHCVENLQSIFGEAGNIKHIIIRDQHATKESRKVTAAEKLLSGKLHALVEYDTMEAAEKAVALLNNEQDWRYGLRVKLLKKKDVDHLTMDKTGEHPQKEKNGDHSQKENGQRNRHRGRGRRQKYHGANGHGRGTTPSSHVEPSKPPPGPKMPDGTRGFTMGRGRPLVSNAS